MYDESAFCDHCREQFPSRLRLVLHIQRTHCQDDPRFLRSADGQWRRVEDVEVSEALV